MRPLFIPDNPEILRNEISQDLTEGTKPSAYKECQVCGSHQAVKGHLISRAWLQHISGNGKVELFSSLPLPHPRSLQAKGISPVEYFPRLIGVGNATAGYFTCEEHEQLFTPIDSSDFDLQEPENLSLMAYKCVLAALWQQKLLLQAMVKVSEKTPDNEVFRVMKNRYRANANGLQGYAAQIKRCLKPSDCFNCRGKGCRVISHKVFRVPGDSVAAAMQSGDGHRSLSDANRPVMHWSPWAGYNLVPTESGQYLVLHYFRNEHGPNEYRDLDFFADRLSRLQGRKRQGTVASFLLDHCENIALSPERWLSLGARRQAVIQDRYAITLSPFGIVTPEQFEERMQAASLPLYDNQINFFRLKK